MTFHPKVYLFYNDEKFALYIGSVNFKDSAMLMNWEAMALVKGNVEEDEIFTEVINYSDRLSDTGQDDIYGDEE